MNAPAPKVELPSVLKPHIRATIATKDALDPRSFTLHERISELPTARVVVRADSGHIDFDAVIGKPASLTVDVTPAIRRTFDGICSQIHQLSYVKNGSSTYQLTIVPRLWLATQRRNFRMFQYESEPDIVQKLLREWRVPFEVRYDEAAYLGRKYRVQYGESDYAFMCRMLEDVGIAFYFDGKGKLILTDKAHAAEPRQPIPYNHEIGGTSFGVGVTDVEVGKRVRPGKYTIRDHDYRRGASFVLEAGASATSTPDELELERFHYVPGAFLFESEPSGSSPTADDRGAARHDPSEGAKVAQRRLEAKRASAGYIAFASTVFDLRIAEVFTLLDHPSPALVKPVLVSSTTITGTADEGCAMHCEATSTAKPFRPPVVTPKPRASGVESATVVGPPGQEIHTDEFGRVRVHFHWNRESKRDESSSCWIHVSQGWAGATFGAIHIPRVGQEVIVDFLGGDPDRPVIVGRVHTNLQRVPYPLPENKTKSGWRSQSTPGGGGYNEIMFEDKKGLELVSMHAQRDMTTVVERDQGLEVRNDRRKVVTRDENVNVGRNRVESVGESESIAVAGDRTRTVGRSESVSVGASRSRQVGRNESVQIGQDRTHHVGNDDTLFVGGVVTRVYTDRWGTIRGDSFSTVGHDVEETILHDHVCSVLNDQTFSVGNNLAGVVAGSSVLSIEKESSTAIGGGAKRSVGGDDELVVGSSQAVRIGADAAVEVGASLAETVGAGKSSTIAGACALAVGGALSETVAGSSSEAVGTAKKIVAGSAIHLEAGSAILHLQENGELHVGRDGLDLPHATLRIEERVEDKKRRLVIAFGASKLALGFDGTIELEGKGISFNGAAVEGAPVVVPWTEALPEPRA